MNVFLSLEYSQDNQQLLTLIKKQEGINLVDLTNTDEKVTVITNGPLTELATILLKDYTVKNRIEKILLVGGTDAYGDVTPRAEKNIYADVNSAQHVFMSGIPVIMFGLNVTAGLDNRALAPLVYLLDKSVFKTEECGIFVETKGPKTLGATITDVYSDAQFDDHHCEIVLDIDTDKYNSIIESL